MHEYYLDITNLTFLGWHKSSVAYTSNGYRRFNQPFAATNYGPQYVQGDVIGVGYRPRIGTVFFTRNGKKLDDVAHGLKTQNFFPTVGANGPCTVHVNFGQMGFVFIEANVKKWGLAPMTGSLAPPPPYGSEQGSILLEAGREGAQNSQGAGAGGYFVTGHSRSRSANFPNRSGPPISPGLVRSPTDISLAQLSHIPSHEDLGEGTSGAAESFPNREYRISLHDNEGHAQPPPDYTSPEASNAGSRRGSDDDGDSGHRRLLQPGSPPPPIPSYDAAVGNQPPRP